MLCVALLLLLAAGSCVKCESLDQPASVTVQPGQRLTITCRVSYSISSYFTAWIRQPAGKGLEWIGSKYTGASYTKDSLKNKFSIDLDSSSKTVTLKGENMQPEDSAVYYCARVQPSGWVEHFDYWGQGTEVTVSSETVRSPTLFPLMSCNSEPGGSITLGCLARDFSPKSLTFQWTDASGTQVGHRQYLVGQSSSYTGVSVLRVSASDQKLLRYNCSVTHPGGSKQVEFRKSPPKVTLVSVPSEDSQVLMCQTEEFFPGMISTKWKKNDAEVNKYTEWPPKKMGNLYAAVSVLKVEKTDWDEEDVYTCEVTHLGTTYTKKAYKEEARVTVTLKPPTAKSIFSNNQAELDCTIGGPDSTTVSQTNISWQIDGRSVSSNITSVREDNQLKKTSRLTLSRSELENLEKVRCSAEGLTPVTQDLTFNKGDGTDPKVTVHILPEEDISGGDKVTLVCLVSSPVLQDYYIAWLVTAGGDSGSYTDGVTFPPQKTQPGYLVTSVYTTTKEKWSQLHTFSCNVWPAGGNKSTKSRDVSSVLESQMSFDLSCTIEDDEFSSLWSTASSFIFLFMFSIIYSTIFSLLKMKRE